MFITHNYLHQTLRRKRASDVRFMNILVSLSLPEIEPNFMNRALLFLSQGDLLEVADSRNNNRLCGYLKCNKSINVHPTQTLFLDINDKKIINIEMRKRFCSDWCYAAFKYLQDQLNSKPMWMELEIVEKKLDFYDENLPGCKGEVIFDEEIDELDSEDDSDEYIEEKSEKENMQPEPPSSICENKENVHENHLNKIQNVIRALDNLLMQKSNANDTDNLVSIIDRVRFCNSVSSSSSASQFNSKQHNNVEMVDCDDVIDADGDADNNIDADSQKKSMISTKDLLKNVISSVTSWITDDTKKYLYSKMEPNDIRMKKKANFERNEEYIFDPPVDKTNQKVIRLKIILRRIKNSGIEILNDLKICHSSFFMELCDFLETCQLNSSNILFTNKEVKWLTILLIHLLYPKLTNDPIPNLNELAKQQGLPTVNNYFIDILPLFKELKLEYGVSVSSQGDNNSI